MKRTICVNATPGDATREAERVAENLRASGHTVTIGPEYTMGSGHKAGMLAVDIDIENIVSVNVGGGPQTKTTEDIPAHMLIDSTDEEGNLLNDRGELLDNPKRPRRRLRREVASGGSF